MLKKKRVIMICSLFCSLTLLLSIVGMAVTGAIRAAESDFVDETAAAETQNPENELMQQLPPSPDDLGVSYVLTSGDSDIPQTQGEPGDGVAQDPQLPAEGEAPPADPAQEPITPDELEIQPLEEEIGTLAVQDIYKPNSVQLNLVGTDTVQSGRPKNIALTFTLSQLDASDILQDIQARIELPQGAEYLSASTYSFPGLTSEQQPRVFEMTEGGKNWVVFELPYIAKSAFAGGTIELRANIIPFQNGITPDGKQIKLTAQLYHKEGGVYVNVNQPCNEVTITAKSELIWSAISTGGNTTTNTFPETQNGEFVFATKPFVTITSSGPNYGTNYQATYTDKTGATVTKQVGVIFSEQLYMESVITLPFGITVPSTIGIVNDYISFTGADASNLSSVVVAGDGVTAQQTITLKWLITNPTPATADMGGFSFTATFNKLIVDAAAFGAKYPANTANIETVAGSASPDISKSKVTGVVGNQTVPKLEIGLGRGTRSIAINKNVPAVVEDPKLDESLKIAKKLLTPNTTPLGYGDEATFEISVFGNKTADKTLTNYVLTDTTAVNASNNCSLVPKSLTTGVYTKSGADYTPADTYTLYFNGAAMAERSKTVNFKTSETVTVPAGTTSIEWRFGDVPVDFAAMTNPTVTMTGYPNRAVSTPQTLYNDAYVKFTYDGKNYTGAGRSVGDYYARASANYQVQDTPIIGKNKSGYNLTANAYPSINYPGDELQYTVYMANTGATSPLVDPRVVDLLSKFIYTGMNFGNSETVTTGTPTNYILQNVSWGVYTLNADKSLPYATNSQNKTVLDSSKKVTGAGLKLSLDKRQLTAQSSASGTSTLTTWFTGELEPGTVLAITYKVKLKDYATMFSTYPTEVVNDFKVVNTFKVYHYGSEGGGTGGAEPGPDPGPGYNDGSCEVPVSKPYPTIGITKAVSSTTPSGGYVPGSEVQFTIKVNNDSQTVRPGSEALYTGKFKVVDVLDKNMTYVSSTVTKNDVAVAVTPSTQPDTNGNGTGLTFDLGDYAPGDKGEIVIKATINAMTIGGPSQTLTNNAALYMTNAEGKQEGVYYFIQTGQGVTESNTSGVYNASSNFDALDATTKRVHASATVSVVPSTPLISITKSVVTSLTNIAGGKTIYNTGEDVFFLIQVRNASTNATTYAFNKIVDMLPGGLEYVEHSVYSEPASSNPGTVTVAQAATGAWSNGIAGTRLTFSFANNCALKLGTNEDMLRLIVKCRVKDDFFDLYDMATDSRTIHNFAAVFAEKDTVSVASGGGTLQNDNASGTEHAASGSVPGTRASDWDGIDGNNRIYNYASINVNNAPLLPGVKKFARNIANGVWTSTLPASFEPGQKMGWEMWFVNNSSTVSMVNPTIMDTLPDGFTFDNTYEVKLEIYDSTTDGLTAASVPTGNVVTTYNIGAPAVNGNKLTWAPASYAAKAGKNVVIGRNQIGVLKIQSVIGAQYYGPAENKVYLIPAEAFYQNNIPSGWGSWAAAADIAPHKRGVTASASINVWGILGASSAKTVSVTRSGSSITAQPGETIAVESGETVTYTLEVGNNGERKFRNFVIIDRLPTINDRGVMLVGQNRGSEWSVTKPELRRVYKVAANGTETTIAAANYKAQYATVYATTGFAPNAPEWAYGFAGGSWSDTLQDGHNVMRLAVKETISNSEKLKVDFTVTVPSGQGGVAWNSFAFDFEYSNDSAGNDWNSTPNPPAEPPKVGLETFTANIEKKIVSDANDVLDNPAVPFGGDITFRLRDVKNPKSVAADNFYVEDVINNEQGGLRLKGIQMPAFTGGTTPVIYSISATTKKGGNVTISSNLSSATAQTLTDSEITGALALAADDYITRLKIDFGAVPAKFAQNGDIKLVFEVTKTPGTAYPVGKGKNKAGLYFDNKAQAEAEVDYTVVDLGVTLTKRTANGNVGNAPAPTTDANLAAYYIERQMKELQGKLTARFLLDGVKNTSVEGADLVLSDKPELKVENGSVVAGLVPTSMEFPAFDNTAAQMRVTVRYRLYNQTGWTDVFTGIGAQLDGQTVTFNPGNNYIEEVQVIWRGAGLNYAQKAGQYIALNCEFKGDLSKLDHTFVTLPWQMATNKASLEITYGGNSKKSEDSDVATVSADTPISVLKTVKDNHIFEKEETAVFEIRDVRNRLDFSAKDFTLFDLAQKGLKITSVKMPAFTSSVNYTLYYTEDDLPAILGSYDWMTRSINWTQLDTGSSGAEKTFTMPANRTVRAIKAEFGTVPVGFAPKQTAQQGIDDPVEVSCFITAPVSQYTGKGNNLYEAINEVSLGYTGVYPARAETLAKIDIEDVTFAPDVTKETDTAGVNDNRRAVKGGIARFFIGGVENYALRAAELYVIDTPPSAGLKLERIHIPAVPGANVAYDVEYKSGSMATWTALAADSMNVSATTSYDRTVTPLQVYQLRIRFKAASGADPYSNVPAGFRMSAITLDFRVDDAASGTLKNTVALTNAYKGDSQTVEDSDTVEIFTTENIDVAKSVVVPTVRVGAEGEFLITGVKNYGAAAATNFTVTDVPDSGLYLTQLIMPSFINTGASAPTYNVTVTYSDASTANLNAAPLSSGVSHTLTVPAANATKAKHVTKIEIRFIGSVPRDFAQDGNIVTKFLTDTAIATYAPTYKQNNRVELSYTTPFGSYNKDATAELSVFDDPTQTISIAKACEDPLVTVGDSVTFTVDEVKNPMVSAEAENFTLYDQPQAGALMLRSIVMPVFGNAGSVRYDISVKTNQQDWYKIATAQPASVGTTVNITGLAAGEYVTDIKWEFGKVPAQFANQTPIRMVFATSADLSAYLTGNIAKNEVTLSFMKEGVTYSATDDAQTQVKDVDDPTLSKQTALKNSGDSPATAAPGEDEYYSQRQMPATAGAYSARFLLGGVRSGVADGAEIVLSDNPVLVKDGSNQVVAGLVPTSMTFPAFTNAGAAMRIKVEYKVYNGGWDTAFSGTGSQLDNKTVSFTVGAGQYIEEVRVTWTDVSSGFAQNGPIVLNCMARGDMSRLELKTDNSGKYWLVAQNKAALTLRLGSSVSKPAEASDIAAILFEEEIGLTKTARDSQRVYEKGETAVFELRDVKNMLLYEAQNFTLLDIPQKGLRITSVNVPAFNSAVDYTVYYTTDAAPTAGGSWTALGTGNTGTAKAFAMPNNTTVTGAKIEFGTVPASFAQNQTAGKEDPVEVSCVIGGPLKDFFAKNSATGYYEAKNDATLSYTGINDHSATDSATIDIEDIDFPVEVTKTTDLVVNPERKALRGGSVKFAINDVKNNVPDRAAGVEIIDTPQEGLLLEAIELPTANMPGIVYAVQYKANQGDAGWTALQGGAGSLSETAVQRVDISPAMKVYQFRIVFTDGSSDTVPKGFLLNSAIQAYFRVADQAALGRKVNSVTHINTYLGEEKTATDDDYVDILAPTNIAVSKKAVTPEIAVGKVGEFSITGIKNYHEIDATNFTITDTPASDLYLTQLIVPSFDDKDDKTIALPYEVVATYSNGSVETLEDENGNTSVDTSLAHTFEVGAGKSVQTLHVTKLEIKFKGAVPACVKQHSELTAKFATDSKIATYAPSYEQENRVTLSYNNAWQPGAPYTADSKAKLKVYDTPDDSFIVSKICRNPVVDAGKAVVFEINNVYNPMVVSEAENFTLLDKPSDYPDVALSLTSITMPIFTNGSNVRYYIYIRTDLNPDWRLFTSTAYEANTAYDIYFRNLATGERVTEIRWDFGTVPVGFRNQTPIRMQFTTSTDRNDYMTGDITENTVTASFTKGGQKYTASARARTRVVFEDRRLVKSTSNINTTVVPGQDVTYTVAGFENNSTVEQTRLVIEDLPQEGIEFKRIELPAFTLGSGVKYDVLYRTNLNGNWRAMASGQDATRALTLQAPALAANERFTGIRVVFDRAPIGFGTGNAINLTFTVSADVPLFGTRSINNRATWSYDTASDETPYGSVTQIIEIPEDEVPYASVNVRNPLAVTGEDGMTPLYWILAVLVLCLGLGTLAASIIIRKTSKPTNQKRR